MGTTEMLQVPAVTLSLTFLRPDSLIGRCRKRLRHIFQNYQTYSLVRELQITNSSNIDLARIYAER